MIQPATLADLKDFTLSHTASCPDCRCLLTIDRDGRLLNPLWERRGIIRKVLGLRDTEGNFMRPAGHPHDCPAIGPVELPTGCEICGHFFTHTHRIRPRNWGGGYDEDNVIELCPNHHTAVHFLMDWYDRRVSATKRTDDRLAAYRRDRPLMIFFNTVVKQEVRRQMAMEGRWHPSVLGEDP